jgi:hypothetical protein
MNEERINDIGYATRNPFADNSWYAEPARNAGKPAKPQEASEDYGKNSGVRTDDPITRARNMPSNLSEQTFKNTGAASPVVENPLFRAQTGDTPVSLTWDGTPSQIDMMYRMRMPETVQPPPPPPGGAVTAWSAMMQTLNKAATVAHPAAKITVQEAAPANFLDAPFVGIKQDDASKAVQPDFFMSTIRGEAQQTARQQAQTERPAHYAGIYCPYEGAYIDIALDGNDHIVKLPSTDRSNGANVSFPNSILIRQAGVYYVSYEMNIRSAENCGTITLSLLVDGKQEAGHIHPFALCEMPEPAQQDQPTQPPAADDVPMPETVADGTVVSEAPPTYEEQPTESGYLRLHWQGFMQLRSGAHISMKIGSTHAGVLHMDAGRHTFVNAMLVEPLTDDHFPAIETPAPPVAPYANPSYGPLPQ